MDADDTPEREEPEGTKRCSGCGEEKALSEFHKDRCKKAGTKSRCKVCIRAYNAKYIEEKKAYDAKRYAKNREKDIARVTRWRKDNPEKSRASDHRRRARKANAKGTFTADDWKQRLAYHDYKCIYCGVEKHDTKEKYLTMEHLIPLSRGGTNWPSNLAPSCMSCNCKKHTKTHFEFIEHLNDQKKI